MTDRTLLDIAREFAGELEARRDYDLERFAQLEDRVQEIEHGAAATEAIAEIKYALDGVATRAELENMFDHLRSRISELEAQVDFLKRDVDDAKRAAHGVDDDLRSHKRFDHP